MAIRLGGTLGGVNYVGSTYWEPMANVPRIDSIDTDGVVVDGQQAFPVVVANFSTVDKITVNAGGQSQEWSVAGFDVSTASVVEAVRGNLPYGPQYTHTMTVEDTVGGDSATRQFQFAPPTGFVALPITPATFLTTADSIGSAFEGAVVAGDQILVPDTGFEWELDGSGNATGRIASYTGAPDASFTVQHWSAASTPRWASATVTVEDVYDGTPDAFTIGAVINAEPNAQVASAPFAPTGYDPDIDVQASVEAGLSYRVSLDAGTTWGGWTSTATQVRHVTGQPAPQFQVQQLSAAGWLAEVSRTFTFGGTSAAFSVTTRAEAANTRPVIDLNGPAVVTIQLGSTWTDPVTATDAEDGDLTASIVITGSVDTSMAGIYPLYYDVSDSDGMPAIQAVRHVVVRADVRPGPYGGSRRRGSYEQRDDVWNLVEEGTA